MKSLFERNMETTQMGGADNTEVELGRLAEVPAEEEDEEEEAMLQGERPSRRGTGYAYGGPLPPS